MAADSLNYVIRFFEQLRILKRIHGEYARSIGFTQNGLFILNTIFEMEKTICTQKTICEITFLPKQTVNNVVTAFCRQGLTRLTELPSDRRIKEIHLTAAGHKAASQAVSAMETAAMRTMDEFSNEQRETMIGLLERYVKFCDRNLVR